MVLDKKPTYSIVAGVDRKSKAFMSKGPFLLRQFRGKAVC